MAKVHLSGFLLLALVLCAGAKALAAPTPEWRVDFASTGRLPVGADEKPQLQRNRDSVAVYLHNTGSWPLPPLAARIDMSGATAWSVLERSTTSTYPQHLTILADGSLITSHDNIVRYAADGSMLWSAAEAFASPEVATVIEVGREILVFGNGPNTVARLERATGVPVEKLMDPHIGACPGGMAAAHGVDTVYWVQGCGGTPALSRVRLAPLRVDWSMPLPTTGSLAKAAIAADEHGVHAAFGDGAGSRISRYSAVDGSLLWSVTGAHGVTPGIALDGDGDPLVFGASVVEKLERATGVRRWVHAVSGSVADVDVSAEGIVIVGNFDASGSGGFVERLRGSDGVSQWQSTLTFPASDWMRLTSIVVQGDRVLVAGVACATNAQPERCDLVLWPRGMDGTGAGSAVPTFALPASGRAVAAPSDTTVGAALGYGPLGMQVTVKRVRNADGGVLWDVTRPISMPNVPGKLPYTIDVAASDGGVAVFYARDFNQGHPHSSEAMIAAFDATTGAFRWERSALDLDTGYTDGNAQSFAIDPAGNVFASVHEGTVPGGLFPITQNRRQIRKYAASTGTEIGSVDFRAYDPPILTPFQSPLFRIVDGDILADEVPLPSIDYALTRIDGATGSVSWSNPALAFPYPFGMSAFDSGRAYVATSDDDMVVSSYRLDTGSEMWRATYSDPSDIGYGVWTSYRGSDGAIYAGGFRRIPRPGGSPSSWDSRGLLMRLDGADGTIDWVDRFDTSPVVSPSGQLTPVLDHDGVLYSWQRQARGIESPGYFYTGTATADGGLMGTQVVYLGTAPFPHLGESAMTIEILGMTDDGGAIVHGGFGDASQPHSFGMAKWPAPQSFTGGSLRVSLAVAVQSGEPQIATSFVLEAINDGAIVAPVVDVLLAIPSQSMIGSIACVVGNVSCTAKTTPTSIGHRLDLPPGASVRISGTVRHSRSVPGRFEASAFSPYGFVEMDMKDNIRSLRVDDILFSHSFD